MQTKIPFNRPFIVGKELHYVAQAVTLGNLGGSVIVAAVGAILLTWFIVAKSPTSIKVFNMVVAPALFVLMVVMMFLILREKSFSDLMAMQALAPPFDNKTANFIVAIEVKLSPVPTDHDVRHLHWLAGQLGDPELLHRLV